MSFRRASPTIVLMYHRVRRATRDPFWLTVDPANFADHLKILQRRVSIIPLSSVREPADRPRVALTFDDGYRDNLDVAAPVLAEFGLPATVFVTTRILDDPSPMWWDALEHIVLDAPLPRSGVLEVNLGRPYRFGLESQRARDRALQVLARELRPLSPARRGDVIASIGHQLGVQAGPCRCHELLDRDGVADLGGSPGISLGAHTVNHPQLSSLTAAEQRRELAQSAAALRSLGAAVDTAAYPFGGHRDWDRRSTRAAVSCGFALTVTATGGYVWTHTPRHRVPRMPVRDWRADEFNRHLEGWLQRTARAT